MVLAWKKIRLNLRETFAISYGHFDHRDALLLSLQHGGKTGFGECVQISYYGIDLNSFSYKLLEIQKSIEKTPISTPVEFFSAISTFHLHPFLLSALDCAYWDLFGKLEGKSFAEINGLQAGNLPDSTFTISIAPLEEQLAKIRKSTWNKFKVKCEAFKPNDIEQLLESGKEIALDANTGFTEQDCRQMEDHAASYRLLFVEQPLKPGNFQKLSARSTINWMADEDCQNLSSLPDLMPHYQSINIKLMKCGGLTPALQLISEAKKLGFKTMVGCMTESSVGISAGIAIAPLCDFADLDGANLIENDYATGSAVVEGIINLSENPGLGIQLK